MRCSPLIKVIILYWGGEITLIDFNSWSLKAQKTFWLRLGYAAVRRWNLRLKGLSWLGYTHNAVFKASVVGGDYVLRLHPPGRIKAPQLRSELQWLRAIRRRTSLMAPFPHSAVIDGEERLFAPVIHDRLPPPHIAYASLFEYLPGAAKSAQAMSLDEVFRIGMYLGKLHTAGQFMPPPDFSRPRLNWEGLFGRHSPYHPGENAHVIQAGQAEVFEQVARRLQTAMRALGEGADGFALIHADLLAKNILFHQDVPAALDFEYSGWGYCLYDLTPLLWQFKGERAADYEGLEAALWSGYVSIRPQADAEREWLETFIAGRQLASCRWLAVNHHHPAVRDAAPPLLAQRTRELEGFLDTGELQRRSKTL